MNFPNWIEAYHAYTRDLEAPLAFHTWTAIGTIAGVLRRKCWIDQVHFQWTPNFYIVLCAPPGHIAKSTAIKVGERLIRQVQEITIGPDIITWQKLIEEMARGRQDFRLGGEGVNTTFFPHCSVSYFSSELGNLIDPEDKRSITVLVELWDGKLGEMGKATKFAGSDSVENPCLNIISATTPGWIKTSFTRGMMEWGFSSRTIFVYRTQKRHLTPYLSRIVPNIEHKELEKKLVEDLRELANLSGPFTLTESAYNWGAEWYEKHNAFLFSPECDRILKDYYARKQTHMHKTAMCIAAATGTKEINTPHLIAALKLLDTEEDRMAQIYRMVTSDDIVAKANNIVEFVAEVGAINFVGLTRVMLTKMSETDFQKAMRTAAGSGRISWDEATKEVKFVSESPQI